VKKEEKKWRDKRTENAPVNQIAAIHPAVVLTILLASTLFHFLFLK
jgi:hypothetical protein